MFTAGENGAEARSGRLQWAVVDEFESREEPYTVPSMNLDKYWATYDRTLARIVEEKPQSMDSLKAILDTFEPPSSGEAFFPGGADETLAEALSEAGWEIRFREGDYVWVGTSRTGEVVSHLEGDLFRGDVTVPRV